MSLKELKPRLREVLRTRPRKFQAQGIRFLEERNGRGLIGDDMGVGKTLQVLGYLALHPEHRPIIVVCPSNAKYEWEEQLYSHTKYLECEVLEGQTPYEPAIKDIIIINFEILHYWKDYLLKLKPGGIVVDECHYIKERKTKRTMACSKICRQTKIFIPMSGTPIINRPIEFFPVLNLLSYMQFRSFWKYAFKYCDPKKGFKGKGWDFTGATNIEELHEKVSHLMIRRTKTQVLPELPEKQRITLPVELSNRKEYEKAQKDFLAWYGENHTKKETQKAQKAIGFVKMGKLRQLAAQGKMEAAMNWIDDFLHITDEKLVIFCYHKAIFKQLRDKYKKIAAVGGGKGRARKQQRIKFQKNKKCRLFIGSIKADKESITLTAASTTLHIEMALTPGENDQAEDRILRIGQKAYSGHYYLLAHNSIDDTVWDMVEYKRNIVTRTVDGEKAAEELLNNITQREEPSWLKTQKKRKRILPSC